MPPTTAKPRNTSIPDALRVLATSVDDGEIMAVAHREHPVVGVQFHPESAATEYGYAMLDRFLRGENWRGRDLPACADGAVAVDRGPRPWGGSDDPRRDQFVPPPVELVR